MRDLPKPIFIKKKSTKSNRFEEIKFCLNNCCEKSIETNIVRIFIVYVLNVRTNYANERMNVI